MAIGHRPTVERYAGDRVNDSLRVAVEVSEHINLAAQQNAVPVVQAIRLWNVGDEPLSALRLEVRSDPPFFQDLVIPLESMGVGATHTIEPTELRLSATLLRNQRERTRATLQIAVYADERLMAEASPEVEVLAPTEWSGVDGLPELLAAFVLPNARSLNPILRAASDSLKARTGAGGLNGYQSRDPTRVRAIAEAIYDAVNQADVRYIEPPASFEKKGQKVLLPQEVLGDQLGTCLDLTLTFCGALERCGLHPLVFVIEGHAFPGVWLADTSLPSPTTDDVAHFRNRIRTGELLVFDAAAVTSEVSFDASCRIGEGHLAQGETFHFAVDVFRARVHRILPLSLEDTHPVPPQPEPDDLQLPEPIQTHTPTQTVAPSTPAGKLQRWKAKLLDLSLRNRLLAFKKTKRSLVFDGLDLAALEDHLADGKTFELRHRDEVLTHHDPRSADARAALTGEDGIAAFRAEQQSSGVIHCTDPPAAFNQAATEMYRESRAAMGESGTNTLYLGVGSLLWYEREDSRLERRAPLLLLPVVMERLASKDRWALKLAPEESRINITLLKKLEDDFGLRVEGVDTLPTDASGVDVVVVMKAFAHVAAKKPGWEVCNDCVLSNFSFQKFLMWLDLEAKTEHILANPIVRHIFEGEGEALPMVTGFADLATFDEAHPASELLPVMSADPSQMQAVLAAVEGNSFVLQGPPGTGKSQTITNLVASLLARGRTVLVVSEKMAALDVVHRRLDAIGLGAFSMELHSHKGSKKAVLESLASALESGDHTIPPSWAEKSSQLEDARTQLNEVAHTLRKRTPFGVSTQRTIERLIAVRNAPRVLLDDAVHAAVDPDWLRGLHARLEETHIALDESGTPTDSPWRHARPSEWTPRLEREVSELLVAVSQRGQALQKAATDCASFLGLPSWSPSLTGVSQLATLARLLLNSPAPPLAVLQTDEASLKRDVAKALGQLRSHNEQQAHLQATFTHSLFSQDLPGIRRRILQWKSVFFLGWIVLWRTRQRLSSALQAKVALPSNANLVELLASAITMQHERTALEESEHPIQSVLGTHWAGLETHPEELEDVLTQASAFRTATLHFLADLDPAVAATVRGTLERLYTTENALLESGSTRHRALSALVEEHIGLSQVVDTLRGRLADPMNHRDLEALTVYATSLHGDLKGFRDWAKTVGALSALSELGLSPIVEQVYHGEISPSDLEAVVERSLLEAWWEQATDDTPLLRRFRGADHEAAIARFQELDDECHLLGRQVIAARLAESIPDLQAPGPEMALLKHQLQLQKRHMPLRQLFTKIPNLLRRLKPCVLMSPLSVAQFLDPALPGFDVVVFDEASQIPPWDAVGAIARGRQVIIVGDSKQLPPTTFFSAASTEDDLEFDEDDRVDLDSILEEAVAAGLPQHRLTWHYRSRHESLIAFSNHHYYDSRLHTFPAAAASVDDLGVHLRLVEGFYDRGGSRTNRAEAEAICDEVARVAELPREERPTLGIVTFSSAQQRVIEDLLDARRGSNPELDHMFQGPEGVFVKNLENVQGDERDVIFFSICYGPDRQGRIAMAFGPLNREGGERRLNVAVTRAKEKVIVFSSMRAEQIDLRRTRAVGVKHLRDYLAFAEKGHQALDALTSVDPDAEPDSPLEEEVKAALQAAGWDVDSQVGVSGYRIDLGIRDPQRPGAYLIGIECDGASYHSSLVARERDRLRQLVLESLGWTFHRVWSTDWWHDQDACKARLLDAVERADGSRSSTTVRRPTTTKPEEQPTSDGSSAMKRMREAMGREPTLLEQAKAQPYPIPEVPTAPRDVDLQSPAGLAYTGQLLAQLVAQHAPLQQDHAWRLLRESWGLSRMGNRIRQAFQASLGRIPHAERPQLLEDAFWRWSDTPQSWTEFRVPGHRRTFEEIPLREIANAQLWILKAAEGMPVDAEGLQRSAAKLLGLGKFGKKVHARSAKATTLLASLDDVQEEEGMYRLLPTLLLD